MPTLPEDLPVIISFTERLYDPNILIVPVLLYPITLRSLSIPSDINVSPISNFDGDNEIEKVG